MLEQFGTQKCSLLASVVREGFSKVGSLRKVLEDGRKFSDQEDLG